MQKSHFAFKTLGLAVLAACASYGHAQTSLNQTSLTQRSLTQSVEKALVNNPEVQIRSRSYQAASAAQDVARSGYRPSVDLLAGYGREQRDTPTTSRQQYDRPTASLQLKQILWDGFSAINEVNRLGFNRLSKFYELVSIADQTALEAAKAHIDVRRYSELNDLAKDNWAFHKETLEQIEQRSKAGVGRRVDSELATGRLALAQSNWLIEVSNLHDVSARYERVVGETPKNLANTFPNLNGLMPQGSDMVQQTIRDNPEFLASVANIRAAKQQISIQKAAYGPTIDARASHNWDQNLLGVPGTFNATNAGVYLTYNLFRGFGDDNRVRQAKEQQYVAEETRDKLCRDIRQQTVIANNDARKIKEQMVYLEQHMLSLEKARVAYRQQFDIGQRTLLDLLDIENEVFQARRSLANARYDLLTAELRTLTQGSKILPALGLAPTQKDVPDDAAYKEMLEDALVRCDATLTQAPELALPQVAVSAPPIVPIPVPAPPPPAPPPAPSYSCEETVKNWAIAWSKRNLDEYLGFYSNNFQPQTRADRLDWRKFREARLARKHIAVEIDSLSCKRLTNGQYQASFQQRYRSDEFNDDVQKTLTLAPENGQLKILRESSIPKKSMSN